MIMSDITNGKRSGSSDYRKRAEECVELAQTARTPQQRTMLLHIAETWLRLAEGEVSSRTLIEDAMLGAGLNPDRTLN
jgi:hypothetical protein